LLAKKKCEHEGLQYKRYLTNSLPTLKKITWILKLTGFVLVDGKAMAIHE
jgi:hypothetical protein